MESVNAFKAAGFDAKTLFQSSILIVAQFNASANGPVTRETLAVSLAASVRPSSGRESPNVAYTPAAISVHRASSSVLFVNLAK